MVYMILDRSILLKRTLIFFLRQHSKKSGLVIGYWKSGPGAGILQLPLNEVADVIATDINPHAVCAAKQKGVEVVRTDLARGLRGPFDLVIFNPPYLPTLDEEKIDDWLEYALDGGRNGRAVIERLANEVGRVLAPGGRILLLISSLTGIDATIDIFEGAGYRVEIVERRQVFEEDLRVLKCLLIPQ